MARTGQSEATAANKANAEQKAQAFQTGQAGVGQYNKNIATLQSGGNVGANPFMNPEYLANVNRLQSGALNAQNDAAANELETANRRSGGLNGTATAGAIRDLSLKKMRLGSQLSAGRATEDYGRNLAWQQYLAHMPLETAGAETPYYGDATGGQSAALSSLAHLGAASYGPWNALIQGLTQGGSAGAAAASG